MSRVRVREAGNGRQGCLRSKTMAYWAKLWQRYMACHTMPVFRVPTDEIWRGLRCVGCVASTECYAARRQSNHQCQLTSQTGAFIGRPPLGQQHGEEAAREASYNNNVFTCRYEVMSTRLYTPAGFLTHFEECHHAKKLWRLVQETATQSEPSVAQNLQETNNSVL